MSGGHTPGPWKAVPQGGSSTVIAPTQPGRNDSRIPAYGYDEERGYCIAYPFLEDTGNVRLDFVCFSHEDARLIAAAPELLAELAAATAEMMGVVQRLEAAGLGNLVGGVARQCDMNRTAIARATGAA